MGIHEFESMCTKLIHLTPLPSINKAVNEPVREEAHLLSPHSSQIPLPTVLAAPASLTTTDTAFVVPPSPSQSKGTDNKCFNKNHVICQFCKAKGHTMEKCRTHACTLWKFVERGK